MKNEPTSGRFTPIHSCASGGTMTPEYSAWPVGQALGFEPREKVAR